MAIFINEPHLTHKIWGGNILGEAKGIEFDSKAEPLGETWEVSLIEGHESQAGQKSLSELVKENECPYLVKFIDTQDNLSVQVHPDEAFAKENEGTLGKDECWLVIACKKGAGIYLGLNPGVKQEEFFESAVKGKDVSKLMRFFPVTKGDFFFVPAGTLHAIGKDVTLVEVQQPSGVTYRVWDWNRVDKAGNSRELHIEKAKAVALFDNASNEPKTFEIKANSFQFPNGTELIDHNNFRVRTFRLSRQQSLSMNLKQERLVTIVVCKGSAEIKTKNGSVKAEPYRTVSILKEESIEINPEGKFEFLLVD